MTTRIRVKDLENRVNLLNRIAGFDPDTITNETKDAYCLDWAYGGVKLAQYTGNTGERDPISMGFVTKKECYRLINAYINGYEAAIKAGKNDQ